MLNSHCNNNDKKKNKTKKKKTLNIKKEKYMRPTGRELILWLRKYGFKDLSDFH